MNIFRKTILTALILCSSYVPILSDVPAANANQSFNHAADLKLVPFDDIQHGPQARKVFSQSFGGPPAVLHGQQDTQKAYVLSYQGTVVGVIVYRDRHVNNTAQRYIFYLCVNSAYRNKNYGSYIMHEFEQLSYNQGITEIALTPASRAIPFYTRLGFQLGAAHDMVKTLKPLNQNTPPLA